MSCSTSSVSTLVFWLAFDTFIEHFWQKSHRSHWFYPPKCEKSSLTRLDFFRRAPTSVWSITAISNYSIIGGVCGSYSRWLPLSASPKPQQAKPICMQRCVRLLYAAILTFFSSAYVDPFFPWLTRDDYNTTGGKKILIFFIDHLRKLHHTAFTGGGNGLLCIS